MEYSESLEQEIENLPKSEVAVLMEIPEGETLESEDLMKCLLGSGWKISESQVLEAVESLASKGLLEYDDQGVRLTSEGVEIANYLYEKDAFWNSWE